MRELSNTIGQLQAREQELLTKLKLKVSYKAKYCYTCLNFPQAKVQYGRAHAIIYATRLSSTIAVYQVVLALQFTWFFA